MTILEATSRVLGYARQSVALLPPPDKARFYEAMEAAITPLISGLSEPELTEWTDLLNAAQALRERWAHEVVLLEAFPTPTPVS